MVPGRNEEPFSFSSLISTYLFDFILLLFIKLRLACALPPFVQSFGEMCINLDVLCNWFGLNTAAVPVQ